MILHLVIIWFYLRFVRLWASNVIKRTNASAAIQSYFFPLITQDHFHNNMTKQHDVL